MMAKSNDPFTILSWNSRSILSKKHDFNQILISYGVDVALVQESWLTDDKLINFQNYQVIRADNFTVHGHRGLMTLVKDNISCEVVPHPTTLSGVELLVVELKLPNGLLKVVNLYAPPSLNTYDLDWDALFVEFSSTPTIISGDFNSHHTIWGSEHCDSKGTNLMNSITNSNLVVMESDKPTRVTKPNESKSATDLSVFSPSLSDKIQLTVLEDTLGSDHFVMKLDIDYCPTSLLHPKCRWKIQSADWMAYSTCLETSIRHLLECEITDINVQQIYDEFEHLILDAASKSIPLKIINNFSKSNIWWNDRCREVVESRKEALRIYQRQKTTGNLELLKLAVAEAKAVIIEEERKAWKTLCEECKTNSNHNSAVPSGWHLLRLLSGKKGSNPKFIHPEVHTSVCKEVLLSTTKPSVPIPPFDRLVNCPNKFESPFTIVELEHVLNRKKKDTCPGNDSITYSMIRQLPNTAKRVLLNIMNTCFRYNIMPHQWRDVKIIYIKKPNCSKIDKSSVRPLSLSSCLPKIMNHLILVRTETHIEENEILSSGQHGFRKKHSTLNCLTDLQMRIHIGRDEGLSTMCCFLDISGAFNDVNIPILHDLLVTAGVGQQTANWVHNFYGNKTYHDGVNTSTGTQGLDQGSVMSPLLFNLYSTKLHQIQLPPTVSMVSYCDDFLIIAQGPDIARVRQDLAEGVNNFVNRANSLHLRINFKKTKIMSFHDKLSPSQKHNLAINLGNDTISVVSSHRYLGIQLDDGLRGCTHTSNVISRCASDINALKAMKASSWGNHPDTQETLYRQAILPKITYGAHIYAWGYRTNISRLQILQNTALRQITGAVKTTPIPSLHAVCKMTYIEATLMHESERSISRLIVQNETIRTLSHLFTEPPHRYNTKPRARFRETVARVINLLEKENVCLLTSDNLKFRIQPKHKAKMKIFPSIPTIDQKQNLNPLQLRQLALEHIDCRFSDYDVHIWTDGSKSQAGHTSAAVYCQPHHMSSGIKLSNNCSVYSAELTGLLLALKHSWSHPPPRKILILSDSRSSLEHLKELQIGDNPDPIVQEIVKLVFDLSDNEGSKVALSWVPSHVGLEGNEIADIAAGALSRHPGNVFPKNLSLRELAVPLKARRDLLCLAEHDHRTLSVGSWTKRIIDSPNTGIPWYRGRDANGRFFTNICRVIFGHGNTPLFKNIMRYRETPWCDELRNHDEYQIADVDHVLNCCSRFNLARGHLLREYDSVTVEGILSETGFAMDALMKVSNYISNNNIPI